MYYFTGIANIISFIDASYMFRSKIERIELYMY
jgi:hypothetical protein